MSDETPRTKRSVIEACVCGCEEACVCGCESKTVQPVHLFAGISRVACGATKWLSVANGPGEHITCDACMQATLRETTTKTGVSDGNEKSIDAALRFLREYQREWASRDVHKHFSTILMHVDAQNAVINNLRDEVKTLKWKLANPQLANPTKPDDYTGLLGELLQRIVRLENIAHDHVNPNICGVREL